MLRHQIPRLFVLSTPFPLTLATNAIWPAAFSDGSSKLLKLTPDGVPGARLPLRTANWSVPEALRPNRFIIRAIHATAG